MRNNDTGGNTQDIRKAIEEITLNVGKVVIGKKDTLELLLAALLCEGHVLLEDVPGVGKTVLARAVARSLNCEFKRIQCTPDVLPSDITGLNFYNQKSGAFEFHPGPIMTNILLVDEINRATPRTQSALLEAMQERQISVDMDTIALPRPFFLIATENPIEMEGTFPLPEAQLDRFLMRLRPGYPSEEEERAMISRFQHENPGELLKTVIDARELIALQKSCHKVYTDDSLRNYIVSLIRATRENSEIKLGGSPRAALGLHQAARALAAMRGRSYILPDDIKYVAAPVLAHRLILKTEARLKGHTTEEIIREIISRLPVPVEEKK